MSRFPGFITETAPSRNTSGTWEPQADRQRIEPQSCNRCFDVDSGYVYGKDSNATLQAANQAAFVMIPIKARALGISDPSSHCSAVPLGHACDYYDPRTKTYGCRAWGRVCYAS